MSRCLPCQEDHHAECAHSVVAPCDCLVCIAGLVGEAAIGERPRRRRDQRNRWQADDSEEEPG